MKPGERSRRAGSGVRDGMDRLEVGLGAGRGPPTGQSAPAFGRDPSHRACQAGGKAHEGTAAPRGGRGNPEPRPEVVGGRGGRRGTGAGANRDQQDSLASSPPSPRMLGVRGGPPRCCIGDPAPWVLQSARTRWQKPASGREKSVGATGGGGLRPATSARAPHSQDAGARGRGRGERGLRIALQKTTQQTGGGRSPSA